MALPEKRIIEFIHEHHVLTLATVVEDNPWCSNCFYTYLEEENCFVFTSDDETKHAQDALKNSNVAGSVVLETNTVGKIQGIQFRGMMVRPGETLHKKAKKAYLKKFPYAALMKTSLWVLHIEYIKMTDNRLGFGKKLIWEKETN
ncbi:MAG TPA: pyridoxamine 5'-phosphate oxidase family protein [Draconibacterium sp.]|nr:pyridoxamine 5'-phosphate oxidase family protein [Draconibacterium sp.]